MITLDNPAPNFEGHSTNGEVISLKSLKGKNVVLYFYPKDNTPGCTQEGIDFRDQFSEFDKHNTIIIGVSRDSITCHQKFKEKFEFPFELITDTDEVICKEYDVIKMKSMYGKQSLGVERSTFLIDQTGILRKEWRKVKVAGHAEEVLAAVKSL
jgi:peroxiredoxin Q/BCP